MLITIEDQDSTPVYRQIVDQVRDQVATGRVKPGHSLPSVRELARFLDINVNTVNKAYQGLKRLGLIVTRPGRGAVVSNQAPELLGSPRNEDLLKEALTELLKEARRLGFDRSKVIEILNSMED